MVFLSAMCLNQLTNNLAKLAINLLFKTAIFIAVLISCSMTSAQEYNNWLMGGGAVLNFDTSPAQIICSDIERNSWRFTVMLSDDSGQIALYGYKTYNENTTLSDFVIKNRHNQILVSFPCLALNNVIGCKLPHGGYCIAALLRPCLTEELHVYIFDKNGELDDEFVCNDGCYTFFMDFISLEDDVALVAYKIGCVETYRLSTDGCTLWNTSNMTLDDFSIMDTPLYDIEHTLDGSTIIASGWGNTYVFHFNKQNGEMKGIGQGDIEMFKGHPFESLAREICQNSLDAKLSKSDKPVLVEFQSFDISSCDIPDLENLRQNLRSAEKSKPV